MGQTEEKARWVGVGQLGTWVGGVGQGSGPVRSARRKKKQKDES